MTGTTQRHQLPVGDEIFLDHLAHFVPDVDAATRALARVGFAPTPVSIQVNPDPAGGAPRLTGTGNVTAMFANGYIEVLFKTADTPLVAEMEAAMARYRGVHLAAFAVTDAAGAHRRLAGNGFRVRALIDMARPVDTDATPGTAKFTLARVEPGEMPEGRIQMLTHHTEHLVWQPRWMSHGNGALGLMRILIAVADLDEAASRYARFTGRPARRARFGYTIALDRGSVDLLSDDGFHQLLPEVPIPSLPFMGAYEIKVRSLAALREVLKHGAVQWREGANALMARFPEELGQGAWLFTQD
jgi:hypothetical protein